MGDAGYYGAYAAFDTASKQDAAVLLGADNLIGDVFEIEFVVEGTRNVAWMKNKFGALVGFFDDSTSRQLSLLNARGWKLQALLSFVAFTDTPEPGHYWGEAALICYDSSDKTFAAAFGVFTETIAKRMAEGIRPEVDLGEHGIKQVLESDGAWSPSKHVPLPEKNAGTALLKTRRKFSEKMIEEGRKGNKGCLIFGWLFLLLLIAALMFGLKTCGVF